MKNYRKDRHYFLKYFAANAVVFTLLCLLLWRFMPVRPLHVSPWMLVLVPAGVLFGLVVSTAFHNASHGNIKPRWLNTAISELAGAYTLEGMRNFRVGHALHHRHSDDPRLDPHPPAGQSFGYFLLTSRGRTIACLKTLYYESHGDTIASRRNIALQLVTFHVSLVAKVCFWWLLMGGAVFTLFFLPSYLAYFLGFGHLNWISHLSDDDGKVRIKNHDGTLYYRVMNIITSGGYYHASHHKRPWLYNPSLGDRREAPLHRLPELS